MQCLCLSQWNRKKVSEKGFFVLVQMVMYTHQFGPRSGGLTVLVADRKIYPVWERGGALGDVWVKAEVEISSSSIFQVRFHFVTFFSSLFVFRTNVAYWHRRPSRVFKCTCEVQQVSKSWNCDLILDKISQPTLNRSDGKCPHLLSDYGGQKRLLVQFC